MQQVHSGITAGTTIPVTAENQQYQALFLSEETFLVFAEGDKMGCMFHLEQFGSVVLAVHQRDMEVATQETISRDAYCKLPNADHDASPFTAAAKTLAQAVASKLIDPADTAPTEVNRPLVTSTYKSRPHPGCPECGYQDYRRGVRCPNCDYEEA